MEKETRREDCSPFIDLCYASKQVEAPQVQNNSLVLVRRARIPIDLHLIRRRVGYGRSSSYSR